MTLDLKKVLMQIHGLETSELLENNEKRLELTWKLFQDTCSNKEAFLKKLAETNSGKKANFFFSLPQPQENEPIEKLITCPQQDNFNLPHITIATDGSQINPSAHEFTNACLINVGLIGIPYFKKDIPVILSSEPSVYNSLDEINPQAEAENIQNEDLISYERTLKEIEEIVKLAKIYKKHGLPVVALLDGTLIHWHLEKFNNSFIELFIKRFSEAMLELKSLNIPVASFLSNSRSNDIINSLRIYKCPYDAVDCKKYCSNLSSKNLPCNPTVNYKPVLDRRLIERVMADKNAEAGFRTILFKSNSKILNYYPEDLKIFFFYINTGTEIARVELPSYAANDKKLLELIHNVVAFQCRVGFGYPLVLSEAHLQAVIGKADRQVFYDLIKEHLLKNHKTQVKISSKELKKRISFV